MTSYKTTWGEDYRYICTAHDDIREFANKIVDLVNITKDMGISMEGGLTEKNHEIQKLKEQILSLKVEIRDLKRKIYQLKRRREKKEKKNVSE